MRRTTTGCTRTAFSAVAAAVPTMNDGRRTRGTPSSSGFVWARAACPGHQIAESRLQRWKVAAAVGARRLVVQPGHLFVAEHGQAVEISALCFDGGAAEPAVAVSRHVARNTLSGWSNYGIRFVFFF